MNDGFRSAKTISLIVVVGLGLIAVGDLIAIFLGVGQMASPDMYLDTDDGEQLPVWLMLQGIIVLLRAPIYISTVVMFLVWIYRAHSNLTYLKSEYLEFTPGWAVGWWFVPFLNLFKPYQVVREIWSESDPDEINVSNEPTFLSASLHQAPSYMLAWWLFWIISNISSNVVSRAFDVEDPNSLQLFGIAFIVNGVLSLIAAILAIMVVRDVTDRQDKRNEALVRIEPIAPPPPNFSGFGQGS